MRRVIRPALVVALLAAAAIVSLRAWRAQSDPAEKGFFYDLSAQRIFIGPRDAAPPIRGVDGPVEDGFRALVISRTGRPEDRRSWEVAYLETFTPELKRRTGQAQAAGEALSMGRLEAQTHRLVRRLSDTDWHPIASPKGEIIVQEWAKPGPDGRTPVVCTP
ncbi:MAG: hypothetical protein KF833_22340 [Verrucomicrobiae bacterium]|nr:hypothetical protein [Verrucomicrobiae bacterium]